MKVLFVIDRLELKYFEFNNLVTNFWMIKSLLQRGCQVFITTIDMLKLKSAIAYTSCFKSYIKDENIFYDKDSLSDILIEDFNLVLFRPDPPASRSSITISCVALPRTDPCVGDTIVAVGLVFSRTRIFS